MVPNNKNANQGKTQKDQKRRFSSHVGSQNVFSTFVQSTLVCIFVILHNIFAIVLMIDTM